MVQYFREALAGNGKIHAANNVETYALKSADKFVLTPKIYDVGYIDFLINYCIENKINVIIPLFDIDLPVLAQNKERFSDFNIQVIVSDLEFVDICNDKWLTFNYLKENGFNVPVSFLSIDEAVTAIENKFVNYPLIVKPRWGMGSIGIFIADNYEELVVFYNKVNKTISETYLKYEAQNSLENCIVIQERLLGEEYGLDVFNDLNGKILTCIPKKKLAMRAGETDSAIIVENKKLETLGKRISKLSNHIGNLDIDCFKIGDEFFILEMNCRFGGQYPFAHLAGANFPQVLVDLINGEKIDDRLLTVKYDTVGVKEINPVIFQ